MFNPFVRFETHYIDRILRDNKRYLVTQTYERGREDESRTPILVTEYEDLDYAKIHLGALRDKFKAIIDLTNPSHRQKLESMLVENSHYRVWWSYVVDTKKLDQRLNLKYRDHIKRYITRETNWRIGSGEVIQPRLECIFGELFIHLKRGAQKLKIKFEDIEKM